MPPLGASSCFDRKITHLLAHRRIFAPLFASRLLAFVPSTLSFCPFFPFVYRRSGDSESF